MPTYDASTGEHVDQRIVNLPDGLDVRSIIVTNLDVTFLDSEDRASVLVEKVARPGAGLAVEFGDHVVIVVS